MAIALAQASAPEEKGYWHWSVWLGGSDAELDAVEWVEYTLHPTFPEPVRRVADRGTRFRLDATGWGEFKVHARVRYRDGRTEKLEHWLSLASEAPTRGPGFAPPAPDARVFLSASLVDVKAADELRRRLQDASLRVTASYDLTPDESDAPLERLLHDWMGRAAAAVFLVSEKPSPWLLREAQLVKQLGIPYAVVDLGGGGRIPPELQDGQVLGIKGGDPAELDHVAGSIARWVGTLAPR